MSHCEGKVMIFWIVCWYRIYQIIFHFKKFFFFFVYYYSKVRNLLSFHHFLIAKSDGWLKRLFSCGCFQSKVSMVTWYMLKIREFRANWLKYYYFILWYPGIYILFWREILCRFQFVNPFSLWMNWETIISF